MKITTCILAVVLLCLISQGQSQTCDGVMQCPCASITDVMLDNGTCVTCQVSNCMLCSVESQVVCEVCSGGFILSDDYTECVEVCSEASLVDSSVCICDSILVETNGFCLICEVPNCVLCSSNNKDICDFCMKGYVPNDDSSKCVIDCATSSHSSCTCSPTLSLFNAQCKECQIERCSICMYNDPSVCDLCEVGFLRSSDGTVCSVCEVPYCLTCKDGVPTQCVKCFDGYVPNGVSCSLPTCPAGQTFDGTNCNCPTKTYLTTNNLCQACASNCLSCSNTGCETCLSGYYPNSGGCTKCVTGCLSCTKANSCQQCDTGLTFSLSTLKCEGVSEDISGRFETLVTDTDGVERSVAIVCTGACATCESPFICTKCLDGYYLKLGECKVCSDTCRTCRVGKPAQCLSCYEGLKLTEYNQCIVCPSNCFQCSNKDYCTKCNTGYFSKQGVCTLCPEYCEFCGDTSCEVCEPGYTSVNDKCVQCLVGCSECQNVTSLTCTNCHEGFYGDPSSNQCKVCPASCSACNSATECTSCTSGFAFFDSEPMCYQVCTFPCSSCVKSQPGNCTACYGGYLLNGNDCVEDRSCSANNPPDCIACPSKYALSSSRQCLACQTADANCKGCYSQDLTTCALCISGYYLAQNSCNKCPDICITCNNPRSCTKCRDGFYRQIIDNQPTGRCLPCSASHSCATCRKSATDCTSCTGTAVLQGKTCISNTRVKAQFVFDYDYQQFILVITDMQTGLIQRLPVLYQNRPQLVLFQNITDGSVRINMLLSIPTGVQSNQVVTSLNNIAPDSKIGGIPLLSSQSEVVTVNVDPEPEPETEPETPVEEAQQANLGLILGLSIPLGVLALVGLFIAMKKSAATSQGSDGVQTENKLMYLEEI